LNSLINQTSKEFELICINDASTDKTAVILESYISEFSSMKIFTNERNKGAAYSRQRGIIEASYENIVFIDADDYVAAEFAENINDDIDDESELICYGHIKINEKWRKSEVVGENKTFSPDEAIVSMNCKGYITNYLWDKVFKKSIFFGITPAKEGMIIGEDYHLLSHYLLKVKKVVKYIKKALYYYIIHDDSISHRKFSDKFISTYEAYKELYVELCQQKSQLKPQFSYFFLFESSILVSKIEKKDKESKKFIKDVQQEIRVNYHFIKQCKQISFTSKMSIWILKINYQWFRIMFVIYKKLKL
jgi:beta-1,3-glucosyltransferase cpsVII